MRAMRRRSSSGLKVKELHYNIPVTTKPKTSSPAPSYPPSLIHRLSISFFSIDGLHIRVSSRPSFDSHF